MIARGVPLERALYDLIASKPDLLLYSAEEDKYEVWDRESFIEEVLPGQTQQRVWAFATISVTDAAQAVKLVLTPVGSVVTDLQYNKIMVTDVPAKLAEVEQMLKLMEPDAVEVECAR